MDRSKCSQNPSQRSSSPKLTRPSVLGESAETCFYVCVCMPALGRARIQGEGDLFSEYSTRKKTEVSTCLWARRGSVACFGRMRPQEWSLRDQRGAATDSSLQVRKADCFF